MIDRRLACEAAIALEKLVRDLKSAMELVGPVPAFALAHYLGHAAEAQEKLDEAMIADLSEFVGDFLADNPEWSMDELPFEDGPGA